MNLLETIREARKHLQENGRVSLRVLRRQFELDGDALAEVIEELVEVQHVARREENVLVWAGNEDPRPPAAAPSPLSYTPKHLADKILTSRSALEGERKQVTVLFADVKGSMDLAEQLGPRGMVGHHAALLHTLSAPAGRHSIFATWCRAADAVMAALAAGVSLAGRDRGDATGTTDRHVTLDRERRPLRQ